MYDMCARSYVFLLAGICGRSIGHSSGESYRHGRQMAVVERIETFLFADLFLSGRRVREGEGGSGTSGGEMPDILVAVSAHRNKSMSVNTEYCSCTFCGYRDSRTSPASATISITHAVLQIALPPVTVIDYAAAAVASGGSWLLPPSAVAAALHNCFSAYTLHLNRAQGQPFVKHPTSSPYF